MPRNNFHFILIPLHSAAVSFALLYQSHYQLRSHYRILIKIWFSIFHGIGVSKGVSFLSLSLSCFPVICTDISHHITMNCLCGCAREMIKISKEVITQKKRKTMQKRRGTQPHALRTTKDRLYKTIVGEDKKNVCWCALCSRWLICPIRYAR